MAIRTDIYTIDWSVSPRIIWIDISETEATAQDLYDTVRYYEAQTENMDDDPIIDAAGGEPLGGGVYVGLTVSLLNAQYAFADRPGPTWVVCNMTGGNVVAFTDATRTTNLYPRYPTAYVSADRTASASATSSEQADIEYASFNGGITYDEDNGYAGTGVAPNGANIGTPRAPSNNPYDARTIALARGFNTGYLKSDMTIPEYELDGTTPFEMFDFLFYGEGKVGTNVVLPEIANVHDNTYINCHISGFLDGNNVLKDCYVHNLAYIRGFVETCVLDGTITLQGSDTAHFLDCYSGIPGLATPAIDMGGGGQSLAMRNYNGGIRLFNKTGPEAVSVDLNSGQVKLDTTTVTNGQIVVRGIGKLIDSVTNENIYSGTYGSVEIVNEALNLQTVSDETWSEMLDGAYTASDLMKIMSAVLGGKVSGVGTDTEVFKGLDGSTRVTTTLDQDGNRTNVAVNV